MWYREVLKGTMLWVCLQDAPLLFCAKPIHLAPCRPQQTNNVPRKIGLCTFTAPLVLHVLVLVLHTFRILCSFLFHFPAAILCRLQGCSGNGAHRAPVNELRTAKQQVCRIFGDPAGLEFNFTVCCNQLEADTELLPWHEMNACLVDVLPRIECFVLPDH